MSIATSTLPVAIVTGRDTVAADLGNYYVASTVPGTGLIGHAVSTTLVETKAIFQVFNGGGLNIYPQYLRMTMTVLPAGNTQQQFTTVLDQGNRFSAFVAGNALSIVNQNQASANTSLAQVNAGAVTLTANTANRRIVSHRQFRPTVIGVVGDVYQFSWGSGELVDPSGLPTDGTLRAHVYYVIAPLVVVPGTSMAIHAWGATFSTGATYEYEFGYVEK
jgi:hypothetical protein